MAIGANSLIELSVNQTFMGQTIANIWGYKVDVYVGTPNAVQIAEAWWNHVKATYRAIMPSGFGAVFRSVKITELNVSGGDYAEYDIPIAEQTGTRASSADQQPPFLAVGVRLVVGSRLTRPGQKRLAGVQEVDQAGGVLIPGTIAIYKTFVDVAASTIVLGAPAAGTTLIPKVFRKGAGGTILAEQTITGTIVNPNVTTQNSRKFGRGS